MTHLELTRSSLTHPTAEAAKNNNNNVTASTPTCTYATVNVNVKNLHGNLNILQQPRRSEMFRPRRATTAGARRTAPAVSVGGRGNQVHGMCSSGDVCSKRTVYSGVPRRGPLGTA